MTACHSVLNFNPRSPYGERLASIHLTSLLRDFNPRSPYGERLRWRGVSQRNRQFQSTLPLRGATVRAGRHFPGRRISIHAPLTGSDIIQSIKKNDRQNFNPRSPYGERLQLIISLSPMRDFNPRSPYGERQQDCTKFYLGFCLSSTIL